MYDQWHEGCERSDWQYGRDIAYYRQELLPVLGHVNEVTLNESGTVNVAFFLCASQIQFHPADGVSTLFFREEPGFGQAFGEQEEAHNSQEDRDTAFDQEQNLQSEGLKSAECLRYHLGLCRSVSYLPAMEHIRFDAQKTVCQHPSESSRHRVHASEHTYPNANVVLRVER